MSYLKAAECPGVSQLQSDVGSSVLVSSQHSSPGVRIAPGALGLGVAAAAPVVPQGQNGLGTVGTAPFLPGTSRSPGTCAGCAETCAFLPRQCLSAQGCCRASILLWATAERASCPRTSCSHGTGGWRLSPGPQGCGACCSHSPALCDVGHENFPFVELLIPL